MAQLPLVQTKIYVLLLSLEVVFLADICRQRQTRKLILNSLINICIRLAEGSRQVFLIDLQGDVPCNNWNLAVG